MSTTFRPRRVIPSAVNTPTCINVNKTTNISNEQAEVILSEFVSVSEVIATTIPGATVVQDDITFNKTGFSNSTGNNAVLGQLRRVQRDLRGLPPLTIEVETPNKKIKFDDDNDNIEQPKNKKIKFDSEEAEEQVEEANEQIEVETESEKEVIEEQEEEIKSKKENKEKKDKKKSKKEKKNRKT